MARLLISFLLVLSACQSPRPIPPAIVGPTIVGFFPPTSESDFEQIPGTSEAMAHLRFAIHDTRACLDLVDLDIRYELTTLVEFVLDGKPVRFQIPQSPGHKVGAILVKPGLAPRVVYGTAGPSSLQMLLPAAAAEYFDELACRQEY